jgi:adenylosuccinate synthase
MRSIVLVGIGFGDEGKGSVCDYLVRETESTLVCRFNGGSQAAHNVIHEGKHHTFAQFGSGTFSGARTFLSRFMLVNPSALLNEAGHLQELGISNPLDLVYIDGDAVVTSPFHAAANRIRETHRGAGRHGSCGMGIGETASDALSGIALRVSDLLTPRRLGEFLRYLRAKKIEQLKWDGIPVSDSPAWRLLLNDDFVIETGERYRYAVEQVHVVDGDWLRKEMRDGTTIFEGAQGVLLDQDYGFHPHTTWSNTRFDNALQLLREADFGGEVTRMGITRSYMTRHGDGPFPTFSPEAGLQDVHNGFGAWQGAFRSGAPDYVLTQYAIEALEQVDEIAMTHMDVPPMAPCVAYELASGLKPCVRIDASRGNALDQLQAQAELGSILSDARPIYGDLPTCPADAFAERFGIPVTITSHGPTSADKRRRNK